MPWEIRPGVRPLCHLASPAESDYSRRMAVDPALLEILVCPACRTPVHVVKEGAALKCDSCRRVYPIEDDIPIMLVDEATVED